MALGVGAAFRLTHYFFNPSLTIDDAMLSVNIASRSFGELARPLTFQQTAPLGFLWVVRAATRIGGVNEFALRLVPLLAGMVLPLGVWRLGRRLTTPIGAAIGAAFTALSPILIQYSISVKPYETDALAATGLALATLWVLDARTDDRRWLWLGCVGALAIFLSTPAAFVAAGCGAALALSARNGITWRRVALLGAFWGAEFAAIYFGFARSEAESPYMQWFWDHKFLTPTVLVTDPRRAWDIIQRLPTQVFTGDAPQVVALVLCWLAALWGIWRLWRHHGSRALVVLGPVVVALFASALRRYPVAPRLFVFAAPLVILTVAAGVEGAWVRWPAGLPARVVRGIVGLWMLLLAVLSVNISRLWGAPTRPLIAGLEAEHGDREPLYIYAGAVPAWLFYTSKWEDPADRPWRDALVSAERWDGNAFHNAPTRGRAVADTEGANLVFLHRGRLEVIGLSAGIAWREGQWLSQLQPDSGWADREAARIAAVTDTTVWLLFAQVYRREVPALLHALAKRGGVVVEHREDHSAYLYRCRLRARRP
jgi:4-amino-4-deoxy-L-arabinose transferase-like glycosyltransferase